MLKSALLLASAALVAAQGQPCATVSSLVTRSTSVPIPAQVAFDCLNSVPVDTQGNSKLIDELKLVWQFQSELVWYKNPGSDWEYGPLDIIGELDRIKGNLGSFQSEYALQLAIQNITIRTGNFHFNYSPDILQVFQFRRVFNVASISSDGKALPKLYVHEDVAQLAAGNRRVSDIQQINGQNPYDYLKSAFFSQYIDSDGQMNNMFAKGDTDNQGAFAAQRKFDGNSTDVRWSNSSTASFQNVATTELAFTGVRDGATFFQRFCTGRVSGVGSTSSAETKDKEDANEKEEVKPISPRLLGEVPTIPHGDYHTRNKRQVIPTRGYATAVVESKSGVVSGYFLTGQGYDDVAVLKIISFSNPAQSGESAFNNEFQNTIATFLTRCRSSQKTKLIIDLRENGGGNTNLLLDAFMQLFPEMDPFSAQRYRASDAWVKIGDAVNEIRSSSDLSSKYRRAVGDNIENSAIFRYWAYWHFRKADGTNFASWDEFNGPLNLNSDKLTMTMRYNYSSADRVSILPAGFNFVNGSRPTVFQPANVVMFTDALCGSSCASFHEELKNTAGVKAVTVGGRPENKPIQTITGSKGGEVIPLITFPQYAGVIMNVSRPVGLATVKPGDATLAALANTPQIALRVGDSSSRAQSQDQVRKGDKSATPLQFIYEAADCRVFYTPDTYADPDLAWKQAWDAHTDDSKCVQGSTKHKSSISGGFKPYGSAAVRAEDQPDAPASDGGKTGGAVGRGSGVGLAFVVGLVAAVVVM
ncbi:hypothetical protein CC86DRAFT_339127 [Ophiobolus disseminans]|uniref:Uncharacterized protein n=1 Tax=Ophiobolus disseminans TaxID=1469910 RepID=A0A6A7AKA3_9PLEO|nr:hypothetical protein CC86DRAFT_339127 [Ophiobolus disseminans]